eukprot:PRCOL_00004057-RA
MAAAPRYALSPDGGDGGAARAARCALAACASPPRALAWSPDGGVCAACADGGAVRLYDAPDPRALAGGPREEGGEGGVVERPRALAPSLVLRGGEFVYDAAWHPRSGLGWGYALATAARGGPVTLWDGVGGGVRAAYCARTDAEGAPLRALSVCFDAHDGAMLTGGDGAIRLFDVERPGAPVAQFGGKELPQRGLMGALATCAARSGALAAGSYSRTVGIYGRGGRRLEPLFVLEGHGGGVTGLRWSACGNYVYSGARRDDDIVCWDVRSGAGELYRLRRRAATNQKVQFDIEPAGRYLLSGGTDGRVRAYDLRDGSEVALGGAADGAGDGAGERGLLVCDGGAAAPAAALALNPAVPLLALSMWAFAFEPFAAGDGRVGAQEGAAQRQQDRPPAQAAHGVGSALPAGWLEQHDAATGHAYYVNTVSYESTWSARA